MLRDCEFPFYCHFFKFHRAYRKRRLGAHPGITLFGKNFYGPMSLSEYKVRDLPPFMGEMKDWKVPGTDKMIETKDEARLLQWALEDGEIKFEHPTINIDCNFEKTKINCVEWTLKMKNENTKQNDWGNLNKIYIGLGNYVFKLRHVTNHTGSCCLPGLHEIFFLLFFLCYFIF